MTDAVYTRLLQSDSTLLSPSTLILSSVDFSHHTDEAFARYHDARTIDTIRTGGDFAGTEVDCQNCLKLVTDLAHHFGQDTFDFFGRTSVDTIMRTDSKTGNTSHVFGTFTADDKSSNNNNSLS